MEQLQEILANYGPPVIGALVFVIAAYLLCGWIGKTTTKLCTKAKIELTLARFAGNAARWGVFILALIACLGVFGVETTGFAAVIGASALAVGLAFQGSLSNLAAGVMLLIFRPFKVNDVISVEGRIGTVRDIQLFTTNLDTPDNRRIIIPNGKIFGAVIENLSYNSTRRVDVSIGSEYPADIDQTRQALLDAASSVPNVLQEPAPQVVLQDLGDSSVNWQVRVWTNTENYWPVKDATTRVSKLALDNAHIAIPYPQVDVHLESALEGQEISIHKVPAKVPQ